MLSSEPYASTLVCRFVAEVLERTIDMVDDTAHQRAVQAFIDELEPWMPPAHGHVRSHAPLFYSLDLDEKTGEVSVDCTPEGLLCFRGWLNRQGLSPAMGTS